MKNENRYLAAAFDDLPGYRHALDVAAQAQQKLDEMVAPPPVPASDHPLRGGAIGAWVDANLAHTAAVAELERRRGVLLELKRDATAQAAGLAAQNINPLLARLHDELMQLLDEAAQVVARLDGATNAEEAVANDSGAQWKALGALADEYAAIRAAQDEVMRAAPIDYTTAARPSSGPGEDHASDLRLSNLDDLWPDWRTPDHTRTVRLGGGYNRLEPWPEDPTQQLLAWLVTSPAEAWVPTLPQLDQLRRRRIAKANALPTVVPTQRKPARII